LANHKNRQKKRALPPVRLILNLEPTYTPECKEWDALWMILLSEKDRDSEATEHWQNQTPLCFNSNKTI
jgi:hypothetical protein